MKTSQTLLRSLIREALEQGAAPTIKIRVPLSEISFSEFVEAHRQGDVIYDKAEVKDQLLSHRADFFPLIDAITNYEGPDLYEEEEEGSPPVRLDVIFSGQSLIPALQQVCAWKITVTLEGPFFFYRGPPRPGAGLRASGAAGGVVRAIAYAEGTHPGKLLQRTMTSQIIINPQESEKKIQLPTTEDSGYYQVAEITKHNWNPEHDINPDNLFEELIHELMNEIDYLGDSLLIDTYFRPED